MRQPDNPPAFCRVHRNGRPLIGRVGCQPTVQAARRSPRSVAVDKIQQEIGLPPVTAVMRAGAVRERRLRNVITEGLGVVLDRRRSVTAGARGAMPW